MLKFCISLLGLLKNFFALPALVSELTKQIVLFLYGIVGLHKGLFMKGKWLWRSWQSGRLRYERTRVRIQSSATFIEHLFTVCRKDENKEKRPGMAHFLKKRFVYDISSR